MPQRNSNGIDLSDFPVPVQIIIIGLIAGVIVGIGVKAGVQPDEQSIGILIVGKFCEIFSNIDETEDKFVTKNCYRYLYTMIILSIIITIASVWSQINRVKNWIIGAALYGFGWLIGFLLFISI